MKLPRTFPDWFYWYLIGFVSFFAGFATLVLDGGFEYILLMKRSSLSAVQVFHSRVVSGV
jgi:hypothetical protein